MGSQYRGSDWTGGPGSLNLGSRLMRSYDTFESRTHVQRTLATQPIAVFVPHPSLRDGWGTLPRMVVYHSCGRQRFGAYADCRRDMVIVPATRSRSVIVTIPQFGKAGMSGVLRMP